MNFVMQTGGPLGSRMGVRWGYGSGLPYTEFLGQWEHRRYNPATDTFTEDFSVQVQAILQAGSRVFLQYGYGAASMDAIAAEANVSKPRLNARNTTDGKTSVVFRAANSLHKKRWEKPPLTYGRRIPKMH